MAAASDPAGRQTTLALWQDPNRVGGYLEGNHILEPMWYPLLARAVLPTIRFHDLRHTMATLTLGTGAYVSVVSEMLGHTERSPTKNTYGRMHSGLWARAVEALERLLDEPTEKAEEPSARSE